MASVPRAENTESDAGSVVGDTIISTPPHKKRLVTSRNILTSASKANKMCTVLMTEAAALANRADFISTEIHNRDQPMREFVSAPLMFAWLQREILLRSIVDDNNLDVDFTRLNNVTKDMLSQMDIDHETHGLKTLRGLKECIPQIEVSVTSDALDEANKNFMDRYMALRDVISVIQTTEQLMSKKISEMDEAASAAGSAATPATTGAAGHA